MAEQEPTPEQLAEIAAANEESETKLNYKAPAQKSLQEIQDLDKDDESLRKYKEALLGQSSVVTGQWSTPGRAEMLFLSYQLLRVCHPLVEGLW